MKKTKKEGQFSIKKKKFYFRGDDLFFVDDDHLVGRRVLVSQPPVVRLACSPQFLAEQNWDQDTVQSFYNRLNLLVHKLWRKGNAVLSRPFMPHPGFGVQEFLKCSVSVADENCHETNAGAATSAASASL